MVMVFVVSWGGEGQKPTGLQGLAWRKGPRRPLLHAYDPSSLSRCSPPPVGVIGIVVQNRAGAPGLLDQGVAGAVLKDDVEVLVPLVYGIPLNLHPDGLARFAGSK